MDARRAGICESLFQLSGARRATRGDVAQPVRTERRHVNGCGEGAERLVRTDIAGRLVAPDVLLARAQRHDVRATAVEIRSPPDQPPGHLPDEVALGCEKTEIRP